MGQRMGRPPKATTAEKLAIVDQYYITNTDGDASQLRAHGIYRRLSQFAKNMNCPLEPHDFSRDDAVRRYIDQLVTTCAEDKEYTTGLPIYEPLDVVALMMTGRSNIERVIKDRESYFEAIHIRGAKAIEQYTLVAQQCAQYREAAKTAKEQNDALQQKVDALTTQLRNAKQDLAYLKRLIRKEIEPERAQQFCARMTSREAIVDIVEASVMQSINSLTHDDRQMRAEAQAEADALDLDNLFV